MKIRAGLILFFLSLTAASLPAARADDSGLCPGHYAELAAREKSKSSNATISKFIEGRTPLKFTEGKVIDAKTKKALEALLAIDEPQKAELLQRLRAAYPDFNQAPEVLRLGLNDADSWDRFFLETSTTPAKMLPMLGGLRPLVERLPQSTKDRYLAEIGRRYPSAGKMPEGVRDGNFYPKRLLDAWMRALLPGDSVFHRAIQEGKTPLQAYQAYFDQLNHRVVSHIPGAAASGYGTLDAKKLKGIGDEIRRFLNLPSTKSALYENIMDDGEVMTPRIRIFGSTVKGMGKKGSDLDIGFEFLNWHFNDGGSRGGNQVPGLAANLQAYLAKNLPGFTLDLAGKPHSISQVDSILTGLEPFMLEISPGKVELLVYPHEITAKPVPMYGQKAVYAAPAPERFELK